MIGVALAGADPDVRTLITFGSPVPAEVAPDVLAIDVRHADDPVAALAGPAPVAAQGSSGSVQVSRVVDPLPHLGDVDAAGAPHGGLRRDGATRRGIRRPPAGRDRTSLAGLGDAERVTRTDFSAARGSLESRFSFGRRMMPKIQLITEMISAASTPHQKSPTLRPKPKNDVIHAVNHSRKPLMTNEIRPSVRM